MKPVDKFSIQYSELLEYIYPVTQEYFPDFDYDEETGQAYILPSQTPDTFKGRYNRGILKGKFSFDSYIKNNELQELLAVWECNLNSVWFLFLLNHNKYNFFFLDLQMLLKVVFGCVQGRRRMSRLYTLAHIRELPFLCV